jgi:lipopolysaccharide export system protein LptA
MKLTPKHLGKLGLSLTLPMALMGAIALPSNITDANAQTARSKDNRALLVRSDIQEANSKTGVITARGNVQIFYPSRQIQATSAQAQYYSRERRIVLSGKRRKYHLFDR